MGFGGSSSPAAPPALPAIPPSANPPTMASAFKILANASGAAGKVKSAAGMGVDGTVETSPEGLTTKTPLAPATLLGQ
jgi:hypothetical protein